MHFTRTQRTIAGVSMGKLLAFICLPGTLLQAAGAQTTDPRLLQLQEQVRKIEAAKAAGKHLNDVGPLVHNVGPLVQSGGGPLVHSGGPLVNSTAGTAQPRITGVQLSCSPCQITARQPSTVVFTLRFQVSQTKENTKMYDPGAQATTFTLARSGDGGYSVLGSFPAITAQQAAAGRSLTFAARLTAAQPGRIAVQAASSSGAASYAQQGLSSPPVVVEVVQAQGQAQGQTQDPGPGKHGGAGFWGSLLGGLAGSQANRASDTPPPAPSNAQSNPPSASNPAQPVVQPAARPVVAGRGVRIQLPPGFSFNQAVLALGGPLSIKNFDSYQRGGVVPQGGAEIEITSVPANGRTAAGVLKDDLEATSLRPAIVDGQPAIETASTDAFAPGFSYDSQAAYVLNQGRIYKFFLTYRSGDPNTNGFRSAFASVLHSSQFTTP